MGRLSEGEGEGLQDYYLWDPPLSPVFAALKKSAASLCLARLGLKVQTWRNVKKKEEKENLLLLFFSLRASHVARRRRRGGGVYHSSSSVSQYCLVGCGSQDCTRSVVISPQKRDKKNSEEKISRSHRLLLIIHSSLSVFHWGKN